MRKKSFWDLVLNHYFLKIVTILLVILTILQTFYVMKLTQPNTYQQIVHRLSGQQTVFNNRSSLFQKCLKKIQSVHVIDQTGLYFIIPNFIKPVHGNMNDNQTGITVCVHSTPNNLHYLPDLAKQWNGPISLTVFSHGLYTVAAVKSIISIHLCDDYIRKMVTFHLVFPIKHLRKNFDEILDMTFTCDKSFSDPFKDDINYESKHVQYPSNILRNVAIQYTSTQFILTLDIDLVPSRNLNIQFQYFLHRQLKSSKTSSVKSRTAFVLPCFESKFKDVGSMNKNSVKTLLEEGAIRPFYLKACKTCQEDTDYDRWVRYPAMDFLEVAYVVDWEMPWEPFYIADKDQIPMYDSRFKQYGFNRVSQICEMYLKDFRFVVLNNAFLVHRGFKEVSSFHVNKTQEHQYNKKLFQVFKIEMKDRYPKVTRQC